MKYFKIFLRHPFTMLIAGPTGSGKTEFVKKLILGRSILCSPPPQKITYFYSEYQSTFDDMKNVSFIKGLPEKIIDNVENEIPQWLIIDDLMNEASNSKLISELFTKGSHHRNLSIILIVQNLFVKGSESRNISLNSQYIVLFKNPRNQIIASNIARQMFPHKIKQFQLIYDDATKTPYSYLFIDLKPNTDDEIRLLTNIFSYPIIAYPM